MFSHHAPGGLLEELRFAADQGFRVWEDNGFARRPVADQEAIARQLHQLGMSMGTFLAHVERTRPTFASDTAEARARIDRDIDAAIAVTRRSGARFCTIVPGAVDRQADPASQRRRFLDNLRRATERCQRHGLVMLLEPLPESGLYLRTNVEAIRICRAVGSPACKVLLDVYRRRAAIRQAELVLAGSRAEIGYLQIADGPEPPGQQAAWWTLGSLFDRLHASGFQAPVGMDHGNPTAGLDGERALLAVYRDLDRSGSPPTA
jgi:hydroxypyruvate isomerase